MISFLLFICALHGVHGQYHSEHEACPRLLPGLDKMSQGVDISTFDLFSFHQQNTKMKVIDFTCDRGKTLMIDGETYDVPDQVNLVADRPSAVTNSEATFIGSIDELRKATSSQLGVQGTLFEKYGFSGSPSYNELQESIFNESIYIQRVYSYDSTREVDLLPDFILAPDPIIQSYFDERLSAEFPLPNADDDPYKQFISYFGTHYFQKAHFGGLFQVDFETNSDYYAGTDKSTAETQAQAWFLNIIKAHGGYGGTVSTNYQQFQANTNMTTRYYGGNTNLLSTHGIQDWQPTVGAHPWLLSGELVPISNLIRDENKRRLMEKALADHILRVYLDELSRLLAGRMSTWTMGRDTLQNLLNQTLEMQSRTLLTEADVEPLSYAVLQGVQVPQWFMEKVSLCYDVHGDGEAQCNIISQTPMCARPGSMTQGYRDDTDSRQGGCLMKWALVADLHEDWFNSVQICVHWRADGTNFAQCGGAPTGETCAPVNNYTQEYRDDTNRYDGACLMGWQLRVNESAPAWIQNIQLCHEWRADGDSAQCGGPGQHLCAMANQWTPDFRDQTDTRNGGCYHGWGIKMTHL